MPHSLQMPKSDRSDHDLPSAPGNQGNQEPGEQTPPPEREQLQCRHEHGEETSDASDDGSAHVAHTTSSSPIGSSGSGNNPLPLFRSAAAGHLRFQTLSPSSFHPVTRPSLNHQTAAQAHGARATGLMPPETKCGCTHATPSRHLPTRQTHAIWPETEQKAVPTQSAVQPLCTARAQWVQPPPWPWQNPIRESLCMPAACETHADIRHGGVLRHVSCVDACDRTGIPDICVEAKNVAWDVACTVGGLRAVLPLAICSHVTCKSAIPWPARHPQGHVH